jgi:hypothetical protein
MKDDRSTLPARKRTPWNKGKLIGAKPPLLTRHVWSRIGYIHRLHAGCSAKPDGNIKCSSATRACKRRSKL